MSHTSALAQYVTRLGVSEPDAKFARAVGNDFDQSADFITLEGELSIYHQLLHHESYVRVACEDESVGRFAVFMKTTYAPRAYATIAQPVESIAGYMSSAELELLFGTVKSLPHDAAIVELGSLYGRSSAAMTFACFGTQRKVYCVDKFAEFGELWANNIRRVRGHPYAVYVRGLTDASLKNWQNIGGGRQIDFIFNDASHEYSDTLREYELAFPLVKAGGLIGFHDVIPAWPGSKWIWDYVASKSLGDHRRADTLAIGRKGTAPLQKASIAPAQPDARDLPIRFVTLALNAEPFIRRHIDVLRRLPFRWHWHIVEGLDAEGHGKGWIDEHTHESLYNKFARDGLSVDGTGEYLDALSKENPQSITIYRKPDAQPWLNVLDMLNTPLADIDEECVLWRLEPDEVWTPEQINVARELFQSDSSRTAAGFSSRCFVGSDLVAMDLPELGDRESDQGFRAWRFRPGHCWFGPENPRLCEPQPDGQLLNLNTHKPISRDETRARGLMFESHAFATLKQVTQKQAQFGLRNLVTGWHALQAAVVFPVNLRHFFLWVSSDVLVNRIHPRG